MVDTGYGTSRVQILIAMVLAGIVCSLLTVAGDLYHSGDSVFAPTVSIHTPNCVHRSRIGADRRS
jgi:hypothetical protein